MKTMNHWNRWAVKLVMAMGCLGLVSCCLGPRLVYPGSLLLAPEAPGEKDRIETLVLPCQSHAWIRDEPESTGPVVVWCHGNGENLGTMHRVGFFDSFSLMGVPVLAMDYPGYGHSKGKMNEQGVVTSVVESLEEARRRWPGRRLVLGGWSLGSGAAMGALRQTSVDAVILVSPFTSIKDAALTHSPGFLVRWLLRDTYDSLSVAQELTVPVLILHGTRDPVIPFAQGQQIAAACSQGRFVAIEGADHIVPGDPRFWQEVRDFLVTH